MDEIRRRSEQPRYPHKDLVPVGLDTKARSLLARKLIEKIGGPGVYTGNELLSNFKNATIARVDAEATFNLNLAAVGMIRKGFVTEEEVLRLVEEAKRGKNEQPESD